MPYYRIMYLEVLIDSQKPVVYLLNKPEIYIGSLTTNDIVISATGISRKHAKILVQDKTYFIIDQGSTNGTYMANERIAPGKRIEFTASESVRLGETVYLNISEERGEIEALNKVSTLTKVTLNDHDKTQVISLKALEAVKNKKLEKKREDIINKKSLEAKRKKAERESYKKITKFIVGMIALVLFFQYSGFFNTEQKLFPKKEMAKEVIIEGIDEEQDFKIEENYLINNDEMQINLARPKCLEPEEKYFCESIPTLTDGSGGALKVSQGMIIFVNEEFLIKKSMSFLNSRITAKALTDEMMTPALTSKVTFLSFIKNSISSLLDGSHQTTNFFIVFTEMKEGKPEITSHFAVKGSLIPIIVTKFSEKRLDTIKDYSEFIKSLNKYYR